MSKDRALEFLKCRKSFFYFMYNYVRVHEVGGSLKITPENTHFNMVRTAKAIFNYHKAILMASRQLGKSTFAAMILDYCANFFPGSQIIIVNMHQPAAFENLNKIKFIHNQLPDFLKNGLKNHGDRKTFIEYENGSVIKSFYYSTTTSPEVLARSLTAPILYMDESAHVPHMAVAYASAQPVLSKARIQAQKNGYPYFMLITSTPNGTAGTGKWFHDMWTNGLSADLAFENDSTFVKDADTLIKNPAHNSFITIRHHWSGVYDNAWYVEQCRELNFDKRVINQELDLLFVGGTSCIFDDDYLSKLTPSAPLSSVTVPSMEKLSVYVSELDAGDYYIIGVDSAKSLVGDYCAIEIVKYSNLEQVAEYFARVGSITKFAKDLKCIINWVEEIVGKRYILAIENNNVGAAVIEDLENDEDKDYVTAMYNSRDNGSLGINTNTRTKENMITYLYDYISPYPEIVHSISMIEQFSVIEKRQNGTVAAQRGSHDDLFMSYAMTAYAKRMTKMEIEPRLNPEISKKLDLDEIKLTKDIIGPSAIGANFTDMFEDMSSSDLKTFGTVIDNDRRPDMNSREMSTILNDIFGG